MHWSRKKFLYRKSQGTLISQPQKKTSHIDDIVYCVYYGSPACRLISLLHYMYMCRDSTFVLFVQLIILLLYNNFAHNIACMDLQSTQAEDRSYM